MGKTKLSLIVMGVAIFLGMVIFLEHPAIIGAAEQCSIVMIRGRDNIEPNMLTIKKGDCVVWINFTGTSAGYTKEDIQLSFKDGKKCVRATKAPVGFAMDVSKACYITGWLSYGQTASLMFTDPGTYDYQVDFKVGGNNKGTITVK
jgi:plastocyanin